MGATVFAPFARCPIPAVPRISIWQVTLPGIPRFATQCYVHGELLNQRDGLLNAIRDPRLRELLVVPFVPVSGQSDEQIARFDVVLGITPSF